MVFIYTCFVNRKTRTFYHFTQTSFFLIVYNPVLHLRNHLHHDCRITSSDNTSVWVIPMSLPFLRSTVMPNLSDSHSASYHCAETTVSVTHCVDTCAVRKKTKKNTHVDYKAEHKGAIIQICISVWVLSLWKGDVSQPKCYGGTVKVVWCDDDWWQSTEKYRWREGQTHVSPTHIL